MRASLVGEGQNYSVILTSGDLEKVASEPISCPLVRAWESLDKLVRIRFDEVQGISFSPSGVANWGDITEINIVLPDSVYQKLCDGTPYEFSQGAYSVSVRR